ncbi:MAG: hypothetical protein V4682_00305 [Patescibacteria group bacterium]
MSTSSFVWGALFGGTLALLSVTVTSNTHTEPTQVTYQTGRIGYEPSRTGSARGDREIVWDGDLRTAAERMCSPVPDRNRDLRTAPEKDYTFYSCVSAAEGLLTEQSR